jgi:mRNA interferase MazF
VIQSDFLADTDSVLVCLVTTTRRAAPLYRLALPAGGGTGLREDSQVMVDKIMAVRRDRCGAPIGRADDATLLALGRLLAFAVGIAD